MRRIPGPAVGAVALVASLLMFGPAAGAQDRPTGDDPTGIVVSGLVPTPTGAGYWILGTDGRVLAYGDAPHVGSAAGGGLVAPVVGGAATPDGNGYWLFAADGGVFAYGDATFHGSAGGLPLVAPIVAGAATADGNGYWLFAADGGVFAYGDATFHGSAATLALNSPIVGGEASAAGYRLVAADGGVFAYGDATFHGSAGGLPLNAPVLGLRATGTDGGYHLFAADGGVFAYGDAGFVGSGADIGVTFSAFAATPDGDGYWLLTPDGYLQNFGTAPRLGAPQTGPPRRPVDPDLVIVGQFRQPVAATLGPDGALYVAERAGRVWRWIVGGEATLVLDIAALTTTAGERGLLGLAFDPDGGHLYLSHTDLAGDLRIAAYDVLGGPARAVDPGSRRVVLRVDEPFSNHNGGDLHFGPDGDLWIASGDGGSGGDPGDNGQDVGTLLGALLRIRPTPDAALPYEVPADNPFVGRAGAAAEIWAYGLRNPWRFSFDPGTGDLWIADVGQGRREEVDFLPAGTGAGTNFGWRRLEGSLGFSGSPPAGHVLPLHEYDHGGGRCSITGGVVYRGAALPALVGAYLFGDYCSGEVWALRRETGGSPRVELLPFRVPQLVSFATTADGEVLLLSVSGAVRALTAVAR